MKVWSGAMLAALAGGLVSGVVVAWVSGATASDVPAAAPHDEPRTVASSVDLSPITDRLDAMYERLRSLEQRLGHVAASAASAAPVREPTVAAPSSTTVAIDVDSLQRALEQIEQNKLAAMSDEELLRGARIAGKTGDNVADAIRRLQVLLERPLSPEKRAEALVELGMHLRTQGGKESLAASAQALQSVVDTQGIDSKLGRAAAYQMIWTCGDQKDTARGVAMARAYAESPGASAFQRVEGRWAAAILVQSTGDAAAAHRDYEALLRDMGDAPEFAKLAADVRQRMSRL